MKQLELPYEVVYIPTKKELEFLMMLKSAPIGQMYSILKSSKYETDIYGGNNVFTI